MRAWKTSRRLAKHGLHAIDKNTPRAVTTLYEWDDIKAKALSSANFLWETVERGKPVPSLAPA